MSERYVLRGKRPVKVDDLTVWANWFETADRTVKRETVRGMDVSTIFLGMDHNFGYGPPVLWETMVFGGEFDQEQDRCSGGWDDALAMHENMIDKIRGRRQV